MYLQLLGTNVRLLGSMHLFPEGAPVLPKWVTEAYEWAEALAFETDTPTILPFFKSSGSTNLRTVLAPDVFAALEAVWPAEGPVSPLTSVHPWAALLLAPSFCQKTSNGVEPHLVQWATEQSKPISFLETAREVAAALGAVSPEEILAGLKLFASDLSAPQRSLQEIHTAWLARDLAGAYLAASRSPTFAYPGLRGAVLESRNLAWAPVVEQMLGAEKRTLVVVGALHLYGPNNLIELLGHAVELVPTAS
jgi:uncharacterized protein YbaP (TraB family)